MRRRTLITFVVSVAVVVAFAQAALANPHGGYTSSTSSCTVCHALHQADGDPILVLPSQTALCFSCHDGSGSILEVRGAFEGEAGDPPASRHPVPEGVLSCASCHTPHAGPSEGNPMSLAAGPGGASAGTDVCAACHGAGSSLPGGDVVTTVVDSLHHTGVVSDSKADISCKACHEVHGSSNESLLRPVLTRSDGTTLTVDGASGLCLGCHTAALPAYPGAPVAALSTHSTVTSSTEASTIYPGSGAEPGECVNCHDPHGVPGEDDFLRASKGELCSGCHDAEGVNRPADYSYSGAAAMGGSAHSGLDGGLAASSISFGAGGFDAWEGTTEPTPSSPGTAIPAERLEGLRSIDGAYTSTRLAEATGDYDYQMYRFEVVAPPVDVRALTLAWKGYGEEVAGNPVTLAAWDWTAGGGTGAWQQIASQQMALDTTLRLTLDPSRHVNGGGEVYVMGNARNHRDADITSGPTIARPTTTSARVSWATSGPTDGWVEYGTTPLYGSIAGSATRTTWHNVTLPDVLLPGVYHYRVNSTSKDGDSVSTPDARFGMPASTLTPVPDYPGVTSAEVTFEWTTPVELRRPFEYRVRVWRWDWNTWSDILYHESPWLVDVNTYVRTISGEAYYHWTVEARDFEGVHYGVSTADHFEIGSGSTGSCPMLFTQTVDGVEMESDLLGAGKLGLKTSRGYVPPEPQEVYVLNHEPADVGGEWDLRFVEERYEADYLDEIGLYVVDVPVGLDLFAENPQAGGAWSGGVEPALHTVAADPPTPARVVHIQTGEDVTELVRADDEEYLVLNEDSNVDFDYQTLEFDLGDVHDAPQVKIVMDAMSVFPDTNEGTDRSATFGPRTKLEVQDAEGNWVSVPSSKVVLPKPPEFSRPYVFDISDIWVSESRKVRFTFLFKTYIDWIAFDTTADVPLTLTQSPLLSAELRERGMDPRTGDGEIFGYVYGEPTGFTRYFPGAHTRFGDVMPLLAGADDKFVIFGGGDELAMRFEALDEPEAGSRRHWVVSATGYYKNAKIDPPFIVEPLPFAAMSNYPYPDDEHYPDDAEYRAYRDEWNTRIYDEQGRLITGTGGGGAVVAGASAAGLQEDSESGWFMGIWRSLMALFVRPAAEEPPADESDVLHRSLNTDFVGLEVTFVGEAGSGRCVACHAVHGQVVDGTMSPALLWSSEDRLCTAAGTGCHADPANSVSGRNIAAEFSASPDPRAHHDVDPAQQLISGSRITCTDCHNPHVNTAAVQVVDPDDVSTPVPPTFAPYLSESGHIYLAVGAEHDALPPVISDRSIDIYAVGWDRPVIRWKTNEPATSWVDYGTSAEYELGTVGNGTLVNTHAVTMPTLTAGVTYHLRIRTADALGNEAVTEDFTYVPTEPPPAPVLVPQGDIVTSADSVNVTFDWSAVESSDGDPVEYYVHVSRQGTTWSTNSGWISATSWMTSLDAWSNPTYVWRVKARDAVHTLAESPWSAADSFYVDGPVYSCPDLYTWNGEEFAYVTDVMGLGGMAIPKGKGAYVNPSPVEDTIIPPGMLAGRDGSLDIRLTDEKPEIEYIDKVGLVAIDHPADTRLLINDLSWNSFDGGREPTEFFTIKDPQPVQATYERLPVLGTQTIPPTDVSEQLAVEGDASLVYSGLYDDNIWTFDLGRLDNPDKVKLVVSGWVHYANEREKDEWVASGKRPPPSYIEVQDADGNWINVGDAPHPPGYPKTVVYDLTDAFPTDVTEYKVRMRIYMRMNLDYVGVDTTPDDAVVTTELALRSAELSFKGVSNYEQEPYPTYDYYDVVNPTPSSRTGSFTRFGDVRELLLDADDRFVIMDTGDDLAVSFDEPPPPAAGMIRTYMIHTDGYHNSRTGSVEPLPFHGMSGYPYPDDEHYPDDEFHTTYLEEWNTRHKTASEEDDTVAFTSSGGLLSQIRSFVGHLWGRVLSVFAPTGSDGSDSLVELDTRSSVPPAARRTHPQSTIVSAGEPEEVLHYSINTDMIRVSGDRTGAPLKTYAPDAGWASVGSSTPPSTAAPGTPATAGTLADAAGANGVYWTTDEASIDRSWNWQVARFVVPESDLGTLNTMRFEWRGYGEPTTGYGVKFAVYNFETATWDTIRSGTAVGAPVTYMGIETAIPNWFCLRCHDGSPPPGVIVPPGVTNIAASWGLDGYSDAHGPRVGSGSPAGLVGGLRRGMGELPCVSCHDAHGNGNLYHVAESTNGVTGINATSGNGLKALCVACHVGTVADWHKECHNCHSWGGHGPEFLDSPEVSHVQLTPYPNESSNCLLCHNHGSKSSVKSDRGRGVSDVEQAAAYGYDCHPCHDYTTSF